MPVIAVVNRKGGSGKSTLAAHIAAWSAHQGNAVMLGDVDRQQSSRAWLKRRNPALPAIAPWALDQKNTLRVPSGITHVVLDTPGGLHGFELARVVMFADAIVMPVCHSMFDRESAAACHAELLALPRIASGRCQTVTVGMRIDARTHAGETLRAWSEALNLPFLGVLRETQMYVRCLEKGLTIFDIPPAKAEADLAQWQPILNWLGPVFNPTLAANDASPSASSALRPTMRPNDGTPSAASKLPLRHAAPVGASRPGSLMPAQESLAHGGRLSAFASGARPGVAQPATTRAALPRASAPGESTRSPEFLRRG